ncbi:unnamed protein product [Acanthoscelides obtectus]|uniref:Uncharacterized protein n=1 Tax=Acanthoscelides obtectus TaxID=200917 RepID=A0A9P0L9T9_ACAOB|nr:unnamed protein product [Acanthoscelides obtectus]CAK1624397.1 hypothetical protein AOBTE_LOCUS2545 [Acanthoscelides obtectus]
MEIPLFVVQPSSKTQHRIFHCKIKHLRLATLRNPATYQTMPWPFYFKKFPYRWVAKKFIEFGIQA